MRTAQLEAKAQSRLSLGSGDPKWRKLLNWDNGGGWGGFEGGVDRGLIGPAQALQTKTGYDLAYYGRRMRSNLRIAVPKQCRDYLSCRLEVVKLTPFYSAESELRLPRTRLKAGNQLCKSSPEGLCTH